MTRFLTYSAAAALALVASSGYAQSGEADTHDHGEAIAFQLSAWKTMHFDDAAKAKAHAAAVKRLGCEVKSSEHAGHFDVAYRCADWKTVKTQTHLLAEQWAAWLKGAGFDTHHSHVDQRLATGPETVAFRLVDWTTVHKNDESFVDSLRQAGVDVRVKSHGGHSDVSYRCPVWTDIHFADQAEADNWKKWLEVNGFQVRRGH